MAGLSVFELALRKWGSVQLGYRWLGTDYETGSGANKFRYDVVVQGPQIGLNFALLKVA